ncbi:MAG: MMPL family transporter [Desulfobulbaceae bacterium]|nr:MMPL family transporter [Desulfobulbaceae bacterium]
MTTFKKKLEAAFESLAGHIYRFRWFIIAIMMLLAAASVSQLPKLTIDMSDEGFLHPEDPILKTYNDFRDQFGRDDLIVLAIKGDVFSLPFLEKLQKIHKQLENTLPHIDEITSMVNARNTRGVQDGIIVEDLLEKWPENSDALAALKQRVMENPLYINRLISEDGNFTTLLIQTDTYSVNVNEDDILEGFDELDGFADDADSTVKTADQPQKRPYLTDEEKGDIIHATREIADQYRSNDFQIQIAGSPVVVTDVKKALRSDMALFMRLALLMISISLFLMFRRVSAVIMPILVVVLALTSTLALMVLSGTPFKMPTTILPSFLLAVGVGDSVHILSIFFQHFNQNYNKQEALKYALGHSGLAVVMTSLTTAAGLASFSGAEIAPVADLGIFASSGVMLAMVYSLVFLPAMLAAFPLRHKKYAADGQKNNDGPLMNKIMDSLTVFTSRHTKGIIIFSVLLLIFSIVGVTKIKFSHDILSWLPESFPVRSATRTIDTSLKGSVTLELILDTGRENGLYDPDTLNKIEQLTKELETDKKLSLDVGKAMSVADILKEIHKALNENRQDFYVIPQDKKLIPQEFLLFENSGSDDLEDVVDSRFQLARITVKVPWQDAMHYVPFIKEVKGKAAQIFGPDMDITVTGIMALFGRIIYAAIYSTAQSYLIAFAVISVMMMLLVSSIRLGILCMFPNLVPIVFTMGMMGWLGIHLDMFTMLIGSIAIGIAVDDTVHFLYNFKRYFPIYGDPVRAVEETFHGTGKAMLTTTVVLSMGFFIFMLASMHNLFNFGFLTGITLLLALAADFFLAPALLIVASKSSMGKREILK